jgi:hypothetical protein
MTLRPMARPDPAPAEDPAEGLERSGPAIAAYRFCMALLYGRAGRLTAENGGFRPGQHAVDALEGRARLRQAGTQGPGDVVRAA